MLKYKIYVLNIIEYIKTLFLETISYTDYKVYKLVLGSFLFFLIFLIIHFFYDDTRSRSMKVTSVVAGLEYLKDQDNDDALKQTLVSIKPELEKWIKEFSNYYIIPQGFYNVKVYGGYDTSESIIFTVKIENDTIVDDNVLMTPLDHLFNGGIVFREGFLEISYPLFDYVERVFFPSFLIYIIVMFLISAFIIKDKEKIKYIEETQEIERNKETIFMSGAIAHNFRTWLLTIEGYLDMIRAENEIDLPLRPYERKNTLILVDELKPILFNIKEEVNGFVSLFKVDKDNTTLSVKKVIDNTAYLFKTSIKDNRLKINVIYNFEGDVCILGKMQTLTVIFLNILHNAHQAMENNDKKEITICIDGGYINTIGSGIPDVIIRIKDNGKGMSNEVRKNVFTPYYTINKANGTGLGMTYCKIMVEKIQGKIYIEQTEVGKGTTILIKFPTVERRRYARQVVSTEVI